MSRVLFEILLPLVLPTAVYLAWVRIAGWSQQAEGVRWATLPWVWLAGAGALLLALMLIVVTVGFGDKEKGAYVPPHWENGRIIPGHVEPDRAR